MGFDYAVDLTRHALLIALLLAAPILAAGLVIGLVISIIQAVTQIHEQSLALIPKIVVMMLVLAALAPWLLQMLMEFTTESITGSY